MVQKSDIPNDVRPPLYGFSVDNPPFEWCGYDKLKDWCDMYLERVDVNSKALADLLCLAYTRGQNNPAPDKDMKPIWE